MNKYFGIQLIIISLLLLAVSCQKNNEDQAKRLAGFSPDTLKLAGDLIQQLIDSGKYTGIYTLVEKDGEIVENKSYGFLNPVTMISGGGGLVSTMNDYLIFCRMLLNRGELDGVRILEESTVDLIMSDQLPQGLLYRDGAGHGLAGVVEYESGTYAWGGMASTNFWIDPTHKMIIITFTQLIPTSNSYAIRFKDIVYRSIID